MAPFPPSRIVTFYARARPVYRLPGSQRIWETHDGKNAYRAAGGRIRFFRFPERHFLLEELRSFGWTVPRHYRCGLRCEHSLDNEGPIMSLRKLGASRNRWPVPAPSWLVFARLHASQIAAQLLFGSEHHHPDRQGSAFFSARAISE